MPRPPEERALFDRVNVLLGASKARTPLTVGDVAELSDLDATLALVMVLCADIDDATKWRRSAGGPCGYCVAAAGDDDAAYQAAARYANRDEVLAHIAVCAHNPVAVKLAEAQRHIKQAFDLMTPEQLEEWRRLP